MADSPVGSLPQASVINDADLFVLEQDGLAKKLTGTLLTNYIDRRLISVDIVQLEPNQTARAEYNRVTGALVLYVPRGNGVSTIYNDSNNNTVVRLEDGREISFNLVRGDTGKSAYDYAVEQGYTGSETEYAQMMAALYQAGINEQIRVEHETERTEVFQEMMDQVQEKMDAFDQMVDYSDAVVADTTLIITRLGVRVVDTTILM